MKKITGICVSPGKVRGVLRSYKKGVRYGRRDIVVLNEWLTSGVATLKNVGGLLSSRGGITCHASVIAREYGVPCLVAVKNLDSLKEETKIELDAIREVVTTL